MRPSWKIPPQHQSTFQKSVSIFIDNLHDCWSNKPGFLQVNCYLALKIKYWTYTFMMTAHSMAIAILNKSEEIVKNTTAASKYIPRRPRISINWNPPFQTSLHKNSKEIFFRLIKFFFQEQKFFFQETTFVHFFRYCEAKKTFGAIRKFSKFFIFWNLPSKFGLISPTYEFWCCGCIYHYFLFFFRLAMAILCVIMR